MKLLYLTCFLQLTILVQGQPPQGYYDQASGLYGSALQQALHDIIDNHTVITYDYIWTAFVTTDKKPGGKVWDMYSDIPGGNPPYQFSFGNDQCGNYSGEGDCYNREHSWPKSWFSDKTPMYSDLFHLYPTDGYVNSERSNYPFGKVGSANWTSQNGSKVGGCISPGYSGTVFEPIDAYKGDFARTYFYMATRYYNEDDGWAGSDMTNGSQLKPWAMTMLLQWNQQDSVSQKEIDRNNAVYTIQNNRNPFIDHPHYARSIWGTDAGVTGQSSVSVLIAYPNPTSVSCRINLPAYTEKHTPFIFVYSATGKQVDADVSIAGNTANLNIGRLPGGIYLISIVTGESQFVFHSRIVKQ